MLLRSVFARSELSSAVWAKENGLSFFFIIRFDLITFYVDINEKIEGNFPVRLYY